MFWIDCLDMEDSKNDLHRSEDNLIGRRPSSREDVAKLARAFINSVDPSIPLPFFNESSSTPTMFHPREGIQDKLDAACGIIRRIHQPEETETGPAMETAESDEQIDDLLTQVDESARSSW